MPPPPAFSSFGSSATIASVVSISAGDRRRVLQRDARDLGRVEDAHLDHVAVLAGRGVEAVVALAFDDLVDDHATARRRRCATIWRSGSSIARSTILMPASWSALSPLRSSTACTRAQQRDAAAGDDAFFDRRTRGVQRVFDARLLFLHLDFGRGADLDHRHAAGQLGHALLQLLPVVVAGRFLDLLADLLDARFDVGLFAGAVDDGRVFLADFDALGLAEVLQRRLLELQAELLRRSPCRRSGWRCLPASPCGDRRSPAP